MKLNVCCLFVKLGCPRGFCVVWPAFCRVTRRDVAPTGMIAETVGAPLSPDLDWDLRELPRWGMRMPVVRGPRLTEWL